ncbi:MAG: aminotransferase class III-fold pyridoxal phosphate-dependent enzyme [Kouleothrix sp.]
MRGVGACLWIADGREYIDCVGGQGAANPAMPTRLWSQLSARRPARWISRPEIFHNDQRAAYMAELTRGGAAGSGSRACFCATPVPRRSRVRSSWRVCSPAAPGWWLPRGFHGRTMGALSATWEPKYREPFAPLIPGFAHVPYDKLDALDAAVTEQTAAVLIELVQGEGGVRPASQAYVMAWPGQAASAARCW